MIRRSGGQTVGGILIVAALTVVPPDRLTAQAPDAYAILDGAVAGFQNVMTLRADFTQVVRDQMIGTNASSRGDFLHQRPNRFAMRWREPVGDVLLSDGSWLWVYLPSSAPNQVVKSSTTGEDLLFDFLDRPRERYTVTWLRAESVRSRPADVLALTPKRAGGQFRRLVVWVDRQDSLPHQLEITEASGTVRLITFDKLRVNTTLPASAFVFRPPAGTRVVDASRP